MPEFAFVQLPRTVRQGLQAQLTSRLQYDRNVTWRQEASTNTTFGQVGWTEGRAGCEVPERTRAQAMTVHCVHWSSLQTPAQPIQPGIPHVPLAPHSALLAGELGR